MADIFAIAERNQKRARHIIDETDIIGIWASFGIRAELVGSLRTGLLLDHLDIDMHVYSEHFSIADSFGAIARLAQNPRIRRIEYVNLLEAEDRCLEWHAWYEAKDGETWKMDMIHILADSRYAGYFERVADAILEVLTPETKRAILNIKNDIPTSEHVIGIEIYQAVLRDGVRDYAGFQEWKREHPGGGIIDWMP